MVWWRERNSKYFYSLEQLNYNKKTTHAFLLNDNTVSRCQKRILAEQFKYYDKLYTANTHVKFKYINNTEKLLDEKDKAELDKPICVEEVQKAIRSMQNGKTPGCDGLPAEWHKAFIDHINPSAAAPCSLLPPSSAEH